MPVSKVRKSRTRSRTAEHRPARRQRQFHHDEYTAVDLFSGYGGLTKAVLDAGYTTIMAANHNRHKIEVHEKNHPYAQHWIADLVDPDSGDYHSAADLPAADLLCAGISCTNHSGANTQRAYAQGLTLFDIADDEDYQARVTRSERDRATALCVLQYARKNRPRQILFECTTELSSWGDALPNHPKIGDGTTYRWWIKELLGLNYNHKILYLNSMFFGVGQSRDRMFGVFWDKSMPEPDLEHRPEAYCHSCDQIVESVWTWRTGIPPSGTVRYGTQYDYRCPRCRKQVVPPRTPSLNALDLTDLGTPIEDRKVPLAGKTMARAERCRTRMPDFPPVLMPSGTLPNGHPWAQEDGADAVATGAIMVAAGNTFERPGSDCRSRDFSEPLWTQPATNTVGVLTPPTALAGHVFAAHRHNGDGKNMTLPMDTNTSTYEKGVLFAAVNNYQGAPRGLNEPLPTVTAAETLSLVSAGVIPFRQNTVPTSHAEPMPTMTAEQIPGLLSAPGQLPAGDQVMARWREVLASIPLAKMHFRMLRKWEVGRACGFDPDFPGHEGTFIVWGTAEQQIDGYGNAVSPPVGTWIGRRLRRQLHGADIGLIPVQRRPV